LGNRTPPDATRVISEIGLSRWKISRLADIAMCVVLRSSGQKPLQRLPSMLTSFVADALLLAMQSHKAMFEQVSRFLLGRPDGSLSHRDTPLFLTSLHSVSTNTTGHRGWLLRYLCRAVHASADYNALERRHGLSLLLSTLSAPYLDKYGHSMILAFIARSASLRVPFIAAPVAAEEVVPEGDVSDVHSASSSDSDSDSDSSDSDSSDSDSDDGEDEDEDGDVKLATPVPTALATTPAAPTADGVDRSDVLPEAGPRVGIAALRMWRGNGALAQLAYVLGSVQEPLGAHEAGSAKDAASAAHAARTMQLVCATLRAVYVSSVQFVHQRESAGLGAMYTHACGAEGADAPVVAPLVDATNVRVAALGSEFALVSQQLTQAAVRIVHSRLAALAHLAALGREELLLVEEEQAAATGGEDEEAAAGDAAEEDEEAADAKEEAQVRAQRTMAQALGVAASALQLQLHTAHWVASRNGGSVLAVGCEVAGLVAPALPAAAVLKAAADGAAHAMHLPVCAEASHSVLLVVSLLLEATAAWRTAAPTGSIALGSDTDADLGLATTTLLRCVHAGGSFLPAPLVSCVGGAVQRALALSGKSHPLMQAGTPSAGQSAVACQKLFLTGALADTVDALQGQAAGARAVGAAWLSDEAMPPVALPAPSSPVHAPVATAGAGAPKSSKKAKKRSREVADSEHVTPVKTDAAPRSSKTTGKKKAKSSKKARRESLQ
jgi:hypothetical protein